MEKVCVWAAFSDVWIDIPPAGGLVTSVVRMVTVWSWVPNAADALMADVKTWSTGIVVVVRVAVVVGVVVGVGGVGVVVGVVVVDKVGVVVDGVGVVDAGV